MGLPSTPGVTWSHDVLNAAMEQASIVLPEALHCALDAGRQPHPDRPLKIGFELLDIGVPTLWTPRPPTRDEAENWWPGTYGNLMEHDTYLLMVQHAYKLEGRPHEAPDEERGVARRTADGSRSRPP